MIISELKTESCIDNLNLINNKHNLRSFEKSDGDRIWDICHTLGLIDLFKSLSDSRW